MSETLDVRRGDIWVRHVDGRKFLYRVLDVKGRRICAKVGRKRGHMPVRDLPISVLRDAELVRRDAR